MVRFHDEEGRGRCVFTGYALGVLATILSVARRFGYPFHGVLPSSAHGPFCRNFMIWVGGFEAG